MSYQSLFTLKQCVPDLFLGNDVRNRLEGNPAFLCGYFQSRLVFGFIHNIKRHVASNITVIAFL
jgi:hypothetical protein